VVQVARSLAALITMIPMLLKMRLEVLARREEEQEDLMGF